MMWLLAAAAIAGVVLNNFRRRECFLIWMVTNATWMIYDWSLGAQAQAAMFGVYLGLSIWGWFQWGKKE
jgi:hypothetical protein